MTPPTRRSPGSIYALPVWIWIGVIFAASSIPGPAIERVGIQLADKAAHALEYGVLGFLLLRQQRRQYNRAPALGLALAWLLATAVGAMDESYQGLIPGRDPDRTDWLADSIGGLGGALAAAVYLLRTRDPWKGSGDP